MLNRKRVIEFAAVQRLPAIYEFDFIVREGGLMSYSVDLDESLERAAALVDRILKNPRGFRLSSRRSSDSFSISRQRELSISRCRPRCSSALTR